MSKWTGWVFGTRKEPTQWQLENWYEPDITFTTQSGTFSLEFNIDKTEFDWWQGSCSKFSYKGNILSESPIKIKQTLYKGFYGWGFNIVYSPYLRRESDQPWKGKVYLDEPKKIVIDREPQPEEEQELMILYKSYRSDASLSHRKLLYEEFIQPMKAIFTDYPEFLNEVNKRYSKRAAISWGERARHELRKAQKTYEDFMDRARFYSMEESQELGNWRKIMLGGDDDE